MAKVRSIIGKHYSVILLILAIFALYAAIAKPMVWPTQIQADIKQLREDMQSKADRVKVEGDQALIQKDISYLKEKIDGLEEMIKFMYRRSGGKPLEGRG